MANDENNQSEPFIIEDPHAGLTDQQFEGFRSHLEEAQRIGLPLEIEANAEIPYAYVPLDPAIYGINRIIIDPFERIALSDIAEIHKAIQTADMPKIESFEFYNNMVNIDTVLIENNRPIFLGHGLYATQEILEERGIDAQYGDITAYPSPNQGQILFQSSVGIFYEINKSHVNLSADWDSNPGIYALSLLSERTPLYKNKDWKAQQGDDPNDHSVEHLKLHASAASTGGFLITQEMVTAYKIFKNSPENNPEQANGKLATLAREHDFETYQGKGLIQIEPTAKTAFVGKVTFDPDIFDSGVSIEDIRQLIDAATQDGSPLIITNAIKPDKFDFSKSDYLNMRPLETLDTDGSGDRTFQQEIIKVNATWLADDKSVEAWPYQDRDGKERYAFQHPNGEYYSVDAELVATEPTDNNAQHHAIDLIMTNIRPIPGMNTYALEITPEIIQQHKEFLASQNPDNDPALVEIQYTALDPTEKGGTTGLKENFDNKASKQPIQPGEDVAVKEAAENVKTPDATSDKKVAEAIVTPPTKPVV